MGNHLAKNTYKRAERQATARKATDTFMKKYDKSKTGTLNREEVKALAQDLLTDYTPLVGGLQDEEIDMIMRCGGETCHPEISAADLPMALAVMDCVRDCNKEYHEMFTKYDKDKTGKISAEQLTGLINELCDDLRPLKSDVDFILKQCEPRGKSDAIAEHQLKAALACWYCLRPPTSDRIKQMFKSWDTTGNGVITKEELKAVMKRMKADLDDAALDKLFNSIDKRQNGVIEYCEFVDWVMQGGVPVAAA